MNPQIQGCMEKIREMNVPESKKKQLCSVLGGIENSNNEEAKLEEWYEFLDLFFNDTSIIEEIYKKMKTNGLCFLHNVRIYFDKDDKPEFYVFKNAGKSGETTGEKWNPQMYYETNIRDCNQKLMAIPIGLIGENHGHSNMLIIRKRKQKNPLTNIGAYLNKTIIKQEKNKTTWIIEHFEPHGRQDEDEYYVNKAIYDLVHDILKYDPEYNGNNIKIIHPNQLCRLTGEMNEILQQILGGTKYKGSCTMFSMWYSFNRVLYPEKESAQIYEEMNDTLLSSKNPSETIENIILSFVSLINIDIDSLKIGNNRFLMTHTQKNIENRKENKKFIEIMEIQYKIRRLLTEQNSIELKHKINKLLTEQKSIELNKILGEINKLLTYQNPIEVMEIKDKITNLLTEQNQMELKQIHDEINKLLTEQNQMELKQNHDEINIFYSLYGGLNKTRKMKKKQQGKHKKRSTKPKKNKK
jgi:hypothetical protein